MIESNSKSSGTGRFLVLAALFVGFGLRLVPPGNLGLNQFDEGIYLIASQWVNSPGGLAAIPPILIPYAPPGYPILVGCLSWLVGLSDQTAILVSALMGTVTIGLAARVSSDLFGSRAGPITAWAIAFAGPHIAFSRMGLTDTTFLCLWAISLGVGLRFIRRPNFASGAGLGFTVGCAQQVKYNGWLFGAIVFGSVLVGMLITRQERTRSRWTRHLGWGGMAGVLAWLIVWPWFQFVENHGGYAGLLSHQRSYLGGYALWWPHFRAQANQAVALSGPIWLTLGLMFCVLGSIWLLDGDVRSQRGLRLCRCIAPIGLIVPLFAAPALSGLILLPRLDLRSRADFRLLAVAWLTLMGLSPFYHPYARLWLPLELLHWILLAGLVIRWLNMAKELRPVTSRPRWIGALAGCALCGVAAWYGPGFPFAEPGPWNHLGLFDSSDSLRQVAGSVRERLEGHTIGIRTFVRPALSVYLNGTILVFPQADLNQFATGGPSGTWGLIDSALLTGELTDREQLNLDEVIRPLLSRWEIVQTFRPTTTLPTALDLDPGRRDYLSHRSLACIWLIRPR